MVTYSAKTYENAPRALVKGISLSLNFYTEQYSSTPTLRLCSHFSCFLFSIWSTTRSFANPGNPQTARTSNEYLSISGKAKYSSLDFTILYEDAFFSRVF